MFLIFVKFFKNVKINVGYSNFMMTNYKDKSTLCQFGVVWGATITQTSHTLTNVYRTHLCRLRTFDFFLLLPDLKIWWDIAICSPNTMWKFHKKKKRLISFYFTFSERDILQVNGDWHYRGPYSLNTCAL